LDALSRATRLGEGGTEFLEDLAKSMKDATDQRQQNLNEGRLEDACADFVAAAQDASSLGAGR
jgi:hypothetical protein